MAKTIDRFKTIEGNPVTLVAANIFSVKPYEGPQLPADTLGLLPSGAAVYEVRGSGGHELVVQLAGDSIKQHVIEALE